MCCLKVPLAMNLDVNEEGMIRPKYFVWPDNGKAYFVDRVIKIRSAKLRIAGGLPIKIPRAKLRIARGGCR